MQNSIDISGILSEFRGSLRLRLGIFLVVVILLVWISLVLGDLKKESLQEIDLTLSELIDMQSVADKSFWQEQLEQQVQLANRSGTTIWQGQSPSQIAASLQSKLYAMASENHILAPEIRTSTHDRIFRDQGLFRLKASIKGHYRGNDVLALLNDIETHSPVIAVEAVSIKTAPRERVNNRFDLILVIYFETAGAP